MKCRRELKSKKRKKSPSRAEMREQMLRMLEAGLALDPVLYTRIARKITGRCRLWALQSIVELGKRRKSNSLMEWLKCLKLLKYGFMSIDLDKADLYEELNGFINYYVSHGDRWAFSQSYGPRSTMCDVSSNIRWPRPDGW